MFELRPYQAEAKQAILSAWDEGYRKTLLVLPTGCGKTVVFSSVTENQVNKDTVCLSWRIAGSCSTRRRTS